MNVPGSQVQTHGQTAGHANKVILLSGFLGLPPQGLTENIGAIISAGVRRHGALYREQGIQTRRKR